MVVFYTVIAFYFGLFFGMLLAHALRRWKEDDRILEKDVELWQAEQDIHDE